MAAEDKSASKTAGLASSLLSQIGVTKPTAEEAKWAQEFVDAVNAAEDKDSYQPNTLHRSRHLFLVAAGVEKHPHRGSWTVDISDETRKQFETALTNLKAALAK